MNYTKLQIEKLEKKFFNDWIEYEDGEFIRQDLQLILESDGIESVIDYLYF